MDTARRETRFSPTAAKFSPTAGRWGLAVAALTVAVFVLRVSQIHQSLLGDEVFTYHDIVGHRFSSLLSGVYTGGENSPPLFFMLAWLSAKLGDATVLIRLPSIILGTATVPLVYLIGRETVGRGAGLIAATVITLSPFSIYYGVEARPYATMAFFIVLSTLAVIKAVDSGSRGWWAAYAIAAAAAAYSHYTSVFVLGVQAAWSLWVCRERIKAALIANVAIGVLYLPWLPHVRGKQLVTIQRIEPLNAHNVLTDLVRAIPGYPYASLRAIPTLLGLIALGICLLIALGLAARANADTPRFRLLVALALASPVGLLIYSLVSTDLWLARGLYASVPAAALVLAAMLVRLPRPLAGGAVAVVLVTLLAATLRAIDPHYVRTPYNEIASYLDRSAGPQDPVVFGTIVGRPAITAQMRKPHRISSVKALPPAQRVFVVQDDDLANGLHVGTPRIANFQIAAHRHYPGIFPTDVWEFDRRP